MVLQTASTRNRGGPGQRAFDGWQSLSSAHRFNNGQPRTRSRNLFNGRNGGRPDPPVPAAAKTHPAALHNHQLPQKPCQYAMQAMKEKPWWYRYTSWDLVAANPPVAASMRQIGVHGLLNLASIGTRSTSSSHRAVHTLCRLALASSTLASPESKLSALILALGRKGQGIGSRKQGVTGGATPLRQVKLRL